MFAQFCSEYNTLLLTMEINIFSFITRSLRPNKLLKGRCPKCWNLPIQHQSPKRKIDHILESVPSFTLNPKSKSYKLEEIKEKLSFYCIFSWSSKTFILSRFHGLFSSRECLKAFSFLFVP